MYDPKTSVMVLKKVLVAFFRLKGMTIQSNDLNLVIKTDLWMSSKTILIYHPKCAKL
jgi:hypothetical protein